MEVFVRNANSLIGIMKVGGDKLFKAVFKVGDGLLLKFVEKFDKRSGTFGRLGNRVTSEHHLGATLRPRSNMKEDTMVGVRPRLLSNPLAKGLGACVQESLERRVQHPLRLGGNDMIRTHKQVLRVTRLCLGVLHDEVALTGSLSKLVWLTGKDMGNPVLRALLAEMTRADKLRVMLESMSHYSVHV